MWIVVRGLVFEGPRVEHDKVGEIADAQIAALAQVQDVGRQPRATANCKRQLHRRLAQGVMADLAGELCAELLAADVASVAPLTDDAVPARAKGVGTLAGWLVAQFGTLDGLRAAVTAVRGWARRTGRTVEVSIGGDVLKVTGVTSQQQGEIIERGNHNELVAADGLYAKLCRIQDTSLIEQRFEQILAGEGDREESAVF